MREEISKSLTRLFNMILKLKPSEKALAVAALVLTFFFLGGGVYNLIYKPIAIIPIMGRYVFYYPYSINEQILNESITVMILYTLGTTGLILMFESTRYVVNPRRAYATLFLGITLLVLAYASIEYLYRMKMGL